MAPLQPSATLQQYSRSPRRGLLQEGGSGKRSAGNPPPPQRSASFHGRTTSAAGTVGPSELQRQMIMRRPKTQPDLLAAGGVCRKNIASTSADMPKLGSSSSGGGEQIRRVPAKVLVNVNVQRSLGALQVMASTEWTVEQLVAAAIKQYVKEGRRPLLGSTDPSTFGLHYSQFSLECLDPKENVIGLGSRNFFLCPKATASSGSASLFPLTSSSAATASSSETLPTSSSSPSSCSKEADKASKIGIPWLRFMDFLL